MATQSHVDRYSPDFNHLRSESARLETFRYWPATAARIVYPCDLARAGLFYTRQSDRVQCAFCQGVLQGWILGDKPIDKHRRLNPNCQFVCETREPEDTVMTGVPSRRQACKDSVGAAVENSRGNLTADGDGSQFGPNVEQPDRVPHGYYNQQDRVMSFPARWTLADNKPSPEKLATAGFYYVGPNDSVRCFQCDGPLKDWQPTDDPWSEHARLFPKCPFLLTNNRQSPPASGLAAGNQPDIDPDSSTNTATSMEHGGAAAGAELSFPDEIDLHPPFRVQCISECGKAVMQVVDDG